MFRRSRQTSPGKVRIFFATDIHGSDRCFRKWLSGARVYEASVLILGGDIAGKTLVPIETAGGVWRVTVDGASVVAQTSEEQADLVARLRASGCYTVTVTDEESAALAADERLLHQRFHGAMVGATSEWVELADARLCGSDVPGFTMLGNDDPAELADVLRGSATLRYAEDDILELPGGYELLSYGYSTPTPWDTPREQSEEDMAAGLERLAGRLSDPRRAIFNLHCPPQATTLDQAPELDAGFRPRGDIGGQTFVSVGSQAVREAIERYRPVLGLHGHVHESAAAQTVADTLCINPGSEYFLGSLRGVVVDLSTDGSGVLGWQMTQG